MPSRSNLASARSLGVATALLAILALPLAVGAQPYSANVTGGNPVDIPESMHDCNDPANLLLTNCGFETGDFTGWTTVDLTAPFVPIQVGTAGLTPGFGLFVSAPTEGTMAALSGFDGNGPGTIEFGQDVSIPGSSTATLEFDYRAGAELMTFGATINRTFEVSIEPAGGGAPMQTDLILTLPAGINTLDTGALSATVDLTPFSGETVFVNFELNVPEASTGPAFFQLDNVLVTAEPAVNVIEVPTLSPVGISLLILVLFAASLLVLRRRRVADS